eukprot:scaffold528306_cov17-Prasinocladus_malaysianus.AAC.1
MADEHKYAYLKPQMTTSCRNNVFWPLGPSSKLIGSLGAVSGVLHARNDLRVARPGSRSQKPAQQIIHTT